MADQVDSTDATLWTQEQIWTMNANQEVYPGSFMISNEELLDLSLKDMNLAQTMAGNTMPFLTPQPSSMNFDMPHMGSAPSFAVSQEESDSSWTEADSQDLWYDQLRQQLQDFRQSPTCTLTTIPLGGRQRKQVHSMANMWGLSHMSVGDGLQKRVLLSKCALAKTGDAKDRRWNPGRNTWSPGYIDPRLVIFHQVSSTICFRTCLNVLGLPPPSKITRDIRGEYCTVYALFETPPDAVKAVLALNDTRPHWNVNATDRNVEACFLRMPLGFSLTSYLLDEGFSQLPALVREAFGSASNYDPNQAPSSISTPPSASPLPTRTSLAPGAASPTELANALFRISSSPRHYPRVAGSALHSRRGSISRRMSLSSSMSRDYGYISASSQVDSDYSLATSASKKRRREPKILAGYHCTFPGCDKAFDHQGELTKHEKVHSTDRPHVCVQCGKGFFYPKDLRRHERTHTTESTPVSPIPEPTGTGSEPDGYEFQMAPRHICVCCPDGPRAFKSELELKLHETERALRCEHCPNRFRSRNELERHHSAVHQSLTYSCGSISDIEVVFIVRNDGNGMDNCAFCGEGFPNPPDWGTRCQHLIKAHQFGSCNKSKKFLRLDHFRQHLKHSHHSTPGAWIRRLEDAATIFEVTNHSLQGSGPTVEESNLGASSGTCMNILTGTTKATNHERTRHLLGVIPSKVAHLFGGGRDGNPKT
ncbi:hypothetical protein CKM354_000912200 [Cercospora kikuchii]|uniref:C2H2 type master regulator of conidiophore development brlA n=1 Tax=Cercospora kikuchii TaxID=84275 RepID=A0A9P3FFW8_9PEZI|nr:uncharacterized protein CKM354_000912200 [Cercospora kikuchii]GIZ45978.1 hypothetical protein CKM354_000912200 [Cercospora kikuchii]